MKFGRLIVALVFSVSLVTVSNACERKYTLDSFIPYLTADYIQQCVRSVAGKIDADNKGAKKITLLSILEGARPFTRDLQAALKSKTEVVEITAKSYEGTESGKLTINGLDDVNLNGKHVIVVDDICDTAKTLTELLKKLEEKKAASIKTCVFLMKNTKRNTSKFTPDFVGTEIEDKFVIGYGLDYDGAYRDLPCVMALKA